MPCRKENYIFLEQSVTVDSKEVDALVTKIGEALQLHNNNNNNNNGAHQKTVSVSMACLHGLGGSSVGGVGGVGGGTGGVKPAAIIGGGCAAAAAPAQRRTGCCMRLRSRAHRGHRGHPYHIPGSNGEQDWEQIKPWSSRRRREEEEEEEEPHRLLQELILSGNLIKEAVRRLQFSGADDVLRP